MIRIVDRTLSCLDERELNAGDVSRFLELLIQTEVDGIEISEKILALVPKLPAYPSYILRLHYATDINKYPGMSHFVCRNADSAAGMCTEIVLSDAYESHTISRFSGCAKIRVQGLDGCLLTDYMQTFEHLKKAFYGEIEFCPTDKKNCASALAAEWVINGFGNKIVTSFCGIGGFAATEELIMILRLQRLRKVGKSYDFFPELSEMLSKITGEEIAPNKAVIGEEIFNVESGVHVDGILKQPKCYEPFPPETAGRRRKILLGKQSGSSSVQAMLDELGMEYGDTDIPEILAQVKSLAIEKNSCVSEDEFAKIAKGYLRKP